MKTFLSTLFCGCYLLCAGLCLAADVVPSTIDMPGTQPGETSLESPGKCDNCHGGYNTAHEPAFNWQGGMMANASRDPIFWATLAVAEQDFDGAGDLCIRCHSTAGWLGGRSTPTDGSGLANNDADGVECDFCHTMTNPANTDPILQGIMNGPFIANEPQTGEAFLGSGMASLWGGSEKLGPYSDADARHQFMKNDFIRSVDFCGTCHDVSNPAVGNLAHNYGAQAQFLTTETVVADGSPSESPKSYANKAAFKNAPYKYGVVERTFSEYKAGLISKTLVDDYPNLPADLQAGALKEIYETASANGTRSANYEDGDLRYYSCQSCHMRPVFGQGCNKNPPWRSDLPLHDQTGGNYWMPMAIKYLDTQGKLRLGGGLNDVQIAALDAGALRAKQQLNLAATLQVDNNAHSVKVVNHTGHKLISGYPEGRRMWLKITWMDDSGTVLRVDGDYGEIGASINGVPVRSIKNLHDENTKIYEAHYGLDQEWAAQLLSLGYPSDMALGYDRLSGIASHTLGELANSPAGTEFESFHFVLNNVVQKDNRIPPYGMDYEVARLRNALPVPANQYNGGPGKTYDYFDTVALNPPTGATNANIELLYQPTSWEYIQFLYLANQQPAGSFLENEGAYMLEAWLNTGMAEPHVMASATWGDAQTCQAVAPTLETATPGNSEVTLTWSAVTAADGYKVYYDQGTKTQFVADVGNTTTLTDTGLSNGSEYCYVVTSYVADCESAYSNILCALPNNQGQARVDVGKLETGYYVETGKGKDKTVTFELGNSFVAGQQVVIKAYVVDVNTGLPVGNATVSVAVTGPESTSLSAASDPTTGVAELVWSTQSPNKRGQGGTTLGSYTATVDNVSAAGFTWTGNLTSTTFVLQ